MTARTACFGFMFATVLSASVAFAAGGDSSLRVGAVHAPAGTDARTRAALSASIHKYVAEAELSQSLQPYTVSPALVQLRRYVEASSKNAKTVCVVDLALTDAKGNALATVRGNVTTMGATQRETLDAAAQAAVSRLPQALQALNADRTPQQVAAH